jgi:hypothetical protein
MLNTRFFVGLMLVTPYWAYAQATNTADRAAPGTTNPVNATPAQPVTPLSESERLHDYLKSWVSPVSLVTTAASAGIGQWRDTPSEWGQGGEGYARRFASGYARHAVYSTLLFGGSSLLGEDNRYVPSPQFGFSHRLGYALESTVLARHVDADGNSHRRVALSRIGALVGAALISRTWQPRSTRGLHSAGVSFATSIGVAAGFNVAREFFPGWLPQ